MTLCKHLHRSLFALPLLALGLLAMHLPPPRVGAVLENVVAASLGCDRSEQPVGALGLARMPGDLGVLTRRLNCAS